MFLVTFVFIAPLHSIHLDAPLSSTSEKHICLWILS